MKAYIIERAGGPEVLTLTDIESPEPKHDEVRIRVRAFGLNRAEAYRRAGNMGPLVGAVVPGIEPNLARLRDVGADFAIVDGGQIAEEVRRVVPGGVDAAVEVVGAATVRDTIKALRPFGAVAVVGLLGGPPTLENLHLMQDLPHSTRLSFFPSGMLGTPALPMSEAPLRTIADGIAAGRVPSLRVRTFGFDEVRQAHTLMESDRVLGKLVVRM